MIEEIEPESYAVVLLETMGVTNLNVSDEDKAILKNLSELKKMRLNLSISALKESCQLNEATLSIAINRVKSKKSANANESTYELFSNFHKLNCGISYYLGDKIGSGGEGAVYAGHSENSCATTPAYSVKQYNSRDGFTIMMMKAHARREAKYAQCLGRKAGWFINNGKVTVVSEWQDGNVMSENECPSTYKQAFSRLANYFKQLNTLHLQGCIHGDLKPINTIVKDDNASLIDFGGARNIYTKKTNCPFTVSLVDPNEGVPRSYPCDMYLTQFIAAYNFNQLFAIRDEIKPQFFIGENNNRVSGKAQKGVVYVVKKSENQTVADKAAIELWKALSEETGSNRCTSEQAYEFCSQIAAAIDLNDELNPDTFEIILNSTLNRNHFTVEDALRGSKRPLKFAMQTADETNKRSACGKS